MSSIFTKIINKELPCYNVLEDEWTLAILSIDPIKLGHTIVFPKVEVDHFFEVPEPYYAKVFENSKIIAKALKAITGCQRVVSAIQGYEVPHFHNHLIPANRPSDLDFKLAHKESDEKMAEILEKIKNELNNA